MDVPSQLLTVPVVPGDGKQPAQIQQYDKQDQQADVLGGMIPLLIERAGRVSTAAVSS